MTRWQPFGRGGEGRRERRLAKSRAEHVERIAEHLHAAGIDPSQPVGGGTLLTENVVVMDGTYRSTYRVARADATVLGSARPVADARPTHRACYALQGLDGADLLLLSVVTRRSEQADIVFAPDGAEVARLEKVSPERPPSPSGRPHPRRLVREVQRLGLAPRTVVAGRTAIGSLGAERRFGRLPRRRIVYDPVGAAVAAITLSLPVTGVERCYVVDLNEQLDERLRAVALLTPFLWDSYTIAWDSPG